MKAFATSVYHLYRYLFLVLLLLHGSSASASTSEECPSEKVLTDTASLQRYLATHDMASLHQALQIRFHQSDRMMDPNKRTIPLPANKIQRGSGLDFTTKYKLEADLEQILYFLERHEKDPDDYYFSKDNLSMFQKAKSIFQKVLDQMPSDDELETQGGYYRFQPRDITAGILEYYNRALYRPEDEKDKDDGDGDQPQSCAPSWTMANILNPELNWKKIEEDYSNQTPQVAVIDNILTEEALHEIRKILLESTVFYQTKRPHTLGGYTGAYIDDGLHDRILLELTSELRKKIPTVLEQHALRYLWAYKYDSTYTGIKLHADMAAVNVNLWITPDEANLDPESGGLVVFTVKPPPEWDIMQYNSDTEKIYEDLLKPAGFRNVTIPYKANRAVIFDSALFHQTDNFRFQKGYPHRRINLTILYGDMQSSK